MIIGDFVIRHAVISMYIAHKQSLFVPQILLFLYVLPFMLMLHFHLDI
jgi:hypothetical protein